MADAVRAAIYCRISVAVLDDKTKVDDQERLCREACERRGWTVAAVYADNNKSAWQRNRKRPGWDAMLTAVAAGQLDAIIVYHGDRLVRQPRDLEDLIDLSRGKGIRLASPTGDRDLDNDDDQFILTIEAAAARRESAATSRRRKMQYDRWRRDGKVRPGGMGGRAFGFERDGTTHVPAETAVIRDIAASVLRGEPMRAIAARLADQGVRSTAGNVMKPSVLRSLIIRPRHAGLMPDGTTPAAWPPVLDRETWEMTRAALTTRPAPPGAGRALKYLLSGIATCGAPGCGGRLWATGPKSYRCPAVGCGKVSRSMPKLDAYVTGRVIGYLRRGQPVVIPASSGAAAELAALTERRAETEAVIAELASHPGQRIDVLARALGSFDVKISQLRDQIGTGTRGRLISAHAGITRAEFDGKPLIERRAIVRACYQITVLPAASRGVFREEYVILSPVTGLP